MEGYQFAHVEVYSLKGAPAGRGEAQSKKKNGQRVWTAAEILDEAERLEHASLHVPDGRPAPEILPGEVDSFIALREAHDAASSVKEPGFERTGKGGKRQTVRRKLRADAASLYACVVSLPVLTEDALNDRDLRDDCMALLTAAMEHERVRIEDLGGTLMMGVLHWDETNVHGHFYALDQKVGRVDHLHPGRVAKKAFLAEHEESGEEKKVLNRGGNRAYCDAMRGWQDDFHEAVFHDAGLLRVGPRRERLSRAEYNHAKRAASERAADAERQKQLRAQEKALQNGWQRLAEANAEELKVMGEFTDAMTEERAEAAAFHAELLEDTVALDRRREALDTRERGLEEREKKASTAEAKEAAAAVRETEADAGIAALEAMAAGLLTVEGDGLDQRVNRAPDATKHPLWEGLWARMSPARKAASKVARSIEDGLRKLRRQARDEGIAQARLEARTELAGLRSTMEAAINTAGQIANIAARYAAKLAPTDRAAMETEMERAKRETAKTRMSVERVEARVPRADVPGSRPGGDAMSS